MPRFDGTGQGCWPGKGLGPCGDRQRRVGNRFWGCLNFFRKIRYNQPEAIKDRVSFLEEQLKVLENEKTILSQEIEKLKRS